MKIFFTLLLVGFLNSFTNAQEFKFDSEIIDYGKIAKGSNGERSFIFTNIGDASLIIKNINSSCGCTIPKKPEKPILPGKKGEIKVSYDTNRLGGFSKQIIVFSNAKSSKKILKIKGFVAKNISLEKEKGMLSNN